VIDAEAIAAYSAASAAAAALSAAGAKVAAATAANAATVALADDESAVRAQQFTNRVSVLFTAGRCCASAARCTSTSRGRVI
jgi:hypothetical protein